jgi:hypothetical protein
MAILTNMEGNVLQGWRLNGQLKEYMNGSHTPEEREDDPRLDGKMT